jgi:hypothetical protein
MSSLVADHLDQFIESMSDQQILHIVELVIGQELDWYCSPKARQLIEGKGLIAKLCQNPRTLAVLQDQIKQGMRHVIWQWSREPELRRDTMGDLYDITALAKFLAQLEKADRDFKEKLEQDHHIQSSIRCLERHGYQITAPHDMAKDRG